MAYLQAFTSEGLQPTGSSFDCVQLTHQLLNAAPAPAATSPLKQVKIRVNIFLHVVLAEELHWLLPIRPP